MKEQLQDLGLVVEATWDNIKRNPARTGTLLVSAVGAAVAGVMAPGRTPSVAEAAAQPVAAIERTLGVVEAPMAVQIDGRIDASGFADRANNTLTTRVSKEKFGNDYRTNDEPGANGYKAEPGVLLFGQEDVEKAKKIAGEKYNEWLINPVTQQVFENDTAKHRIKEGGFSRYSLGGGILEIPGNGDSRMRLELSFDGVTHYNVFVRGLFADGSTPSDRNRTAELSNLAGGNALGEQYPRGAYISLGYVDQLRASAFAGLGNQNGAEGSRKYYEVYMDLNTRALNVLRYDSVNQGGNLVYSNYAN